VNMLAAALAGILLPLLLDKDRRSGDCLGGLCHHRDRRCWLLCVSRSGRMVVVHGLICHRSAVVMMLILTYT